MALEDKIDRLAALVETLAATVQAQSATIAKLRDEVRPKLLRRSDLAAMFGRDAGWLRQLLHRGKTGESRFGAKLLELAHVVGDEQVWYPSEISAHCAKWMGKDGPQ